MADKQKGKPPKDRQKSEADYIYTGGLIELLALTMKFFKLVFFSLIICLAIEYIFSFFNFFGEGFSKHSRDSLLTFIQFCQNDEVSSRYFVSPYMMIEKLLTLMQNYTGYSISNFLSGQEGGLSDWMNIFIYSLLIFAIKLIYLISTIPLMLIVWVCLFADGLIYRSERIAKGTRDSGIKISFARHVIGFACVGLSILYLILPISIHPAFILVPLAIVSGYGLRLAAANFMKYM